jgi:hypothetical protein
MDIQSRRKQITPPTKEEDSPPPVMRMNFALELIP